MCPSITKADFLRIENKLDSALERLAIHDQTLYGQKGEGGLVEQVKENEKDLASTKLGAALGLIAMLAGAIVSKIVGWI